MPLDNAKMTKSARHQMPKNRDKNAIRRDAQDAGHIPGRHGCVGRMSDVRAPGRLNLQCTSLMLSVFAHSFTLLPFTNSVLAKLTINTFTGICPAVFLHILKYWCRHITAIIWLYNVLKLKKTYSFTVFALFDGYSKCPAVSCGFQSSDPGRWTFHRLIPNFRQYLFVCVFSRTVWIWSRVLK